MAHNRKLVLGAVSLVKGRIKNDLKALDEVNDEVEPLLIKSKFVENAPFRWVGLIIRYGTKTVLQPEYQGINHVHGDLAVAVELEMKQLMKADRDELKRLFTIATLEALIAVAKKYDRPDRLLIERRCACGDLGAHNRGPGDVSITAGARVTQCSPARGGNKRPAKHMRSDGETGTCYGETRLCEIWPLYKREGQHMRYWEAWEDSSAVVIHWGTVGNPGCTKRVRVRSDESAEEVIERKARGLQAAGYDEIKIQNHVTVIVQYRIEGWGTNEDLDKRNRVERLVNECLGRTGNGYCDGGDVSSGTMNVFSFVVDALVAKNTIVECLRRHPLFENAIVAIEQEDSLKVVWPENYAGEFSY